MKLLLPLIPSALLLALTLFGACESKALTGPDGGLSSNGTDGGGLAISDASLDSDAESNGGADGGAAAAATCPELASYKNNDNDSSATLQTCIDRVAEGQALELEPGRYALAAQLRLDRKIQIRTTGSADTGPCAIADHGCAEFFALPAFQERMGMFRATSEVTIDHIVLNGNRQGRTSGTAYNNCSQLTDNAFGFNAAMECSSCSFTNGVSKNALCGTGLLVVGPANAVSVSNNSFAYNGVHNVQNLWADGLTVLESSDASFIGNSFVDNTDIDLIFGGCPRCTITGNNVTHSSDPTGGAFAAIMIQKWPGTSGNYSEVDVSGNVIDCGPSRLCGSGLYIGSESWYPETPFGTLTPGTTSGLITNNVIRNTMNALYIAAQGLAIYGNQFVNTHGVEIPNTCGTSLVSQTPIVVSPTTVSCHFNNENVSDLSIHYSGADWSGCIPNWPF